MTALETKYRFQLLKRIEHEDYCWSLDMKFNEMTQHACNCNCMVEFKKKFKEWKKLK